MRCAAIAADPRLARLRETVLTVDTEAERNTALMLDPYKPRECSMRSPVLLVFQILPTGTQPCMRLVLLLPCRALLACAGCAPAGWAGECELLAAVAAVAGFVCWRCRQDRLAQQHAGQPQLKSKGRLLFCWLPKPLR